MMIVKSPKDRRLGCLRHQTDRDRVVENAGTVEDLVGRAAYRWTEQRSAGLSRQHVPCPMSATKMIKAGSKFSGARDGRPFACFVRGKRMFSRCQSHYAGLLVT
jgi:hypothetical protein